MHVVRASLGKNARQFVRLYGNAEAPRGIGTSQCLRNGRRRCISVLKLGGKNMPYHPACIFHNDIYVVNTCVLTYI